MAHTMTIAQAKHSFKMHAQVPTDPLSACASPEAAWGLCHLFIDNLKLAKLLASHDSAADEALLIATTQYEKQVLNQHCKN